MIAIALFLTQVIPLEWSLSLSLAGLALLLPALLQLLIGLAKKTKQKLSPKKVENVPPQPLLSHFIATASPLSYNGDTMALTTINQNSKCGSCTLCCYLLIVPTMNKKAGELCRECVLKKGCKIYERRPQECKEFRCAYHQMDKVNIALRPDNCKMIFEKVSDRIFLGTQDPRYSLTEVAKKQIKQFNTQGFSVIVSNLNQKLDLYLAPHHIKRQIIMDYNQHIEERHGRT